MKSVVLVLAVAVTLLSHVATGLEMELVYIGDVGNAPHSSGYGSVAYSYGIGKYEVTTAQYTEFLNAVAATDTYGLWRAQQSILQSGSSGSYTYTVVAGRENRPIDYVQLRDCMRFVNWLHNGQPTGGQDATTTEDGAYSMPGIDPDTNTVRETDWLYALPNVDEWYKAAYYDSGTASYYDYPTSSDTKPGHDEGDTPNNACFVEMPHYNQETNTQDVGSYTASASPYGTFDQAGNASERTAIVTTTDPSLTTVEIGGRYSATPDSFHADTAANGTLWHWRALKGYGMRVVTSVLPPETGTIIMIE
jgi:formylglycine-generating enzyme required for sulfatase activity